MCCEEEEKGKRWAKVWNLDISVLNLSTRAERILRHNGIIRIADLRYVKTIWRLAPPDGMCGLGKTSLRKIRAGLNRFGLELERR